MKDYYKGKVKKVTSFEEYDINFKTRYNARLEEQIISITINDVGKNDETLVFAEHTPTIFRYLGLDDLSVEMYKDKLARGLFLDNTEKHGHKNSINKNIVLEVIDRFADPIAVFDSATVKGSLVALYDVEDLNENYVMLSLTPNKEKGSILNFV